MAKRKTKRFCSECGAQLIQGNDFASNVAVYHYDSLGGCNMRLDSPYSKSTGKRNVVDTFTCPNARRFFNTHDRFVIYEGETYHT